MTSRARKWTILSIAILLLVGREAVAQEGERIRTIELNGLSRLSPAEVQNRMKLRVDDPFSARELDAEIQRLWKWGEFLYIEQPVITRTPDGIGISFTFVEKQKVALIEFSGNDRVSRTELEAELMTTEGALLNPYALENDRHRIETIYVEKGHLYADVSIRQQTGAAGTTVTFVVREGPRAYLRGVRFSGNNAFDDGELLDFMLTKPRSTFLGLGIPHSGIYSEQVFLEDLDRLQQVYIRRGYFGARVVADQLATDFARESLYLGVRIEEGERYVVSDTVVRIAEGTGVFPIEELRGLLTLKAGEHFDGEKADEDRQRLLARYGSNAYVLADVRIEPLFAETGNFVALHYVIFEGEKIFIEDVEIRGNAQTRDKVIRRELTFFPGEEFDSERIAESESNLRALGYFQEDIRIFGEASPTAPNRQNVIVEVTERDETGRFVFGVGVTSGSGVVGSFALQKRNFDWRDTPDGILDLRDAFTGGGQLLVLEAQPGSVESNYRAEFVEPRFMDSHTSLSLRALRAGAVREQYDETQTGAEIALGHRLPNFRKVRGELAYRYEVTDIDDIELDAAPDVYEVEGITRASSIRGELSYRDLRFAPIIGPVSGWSGYMQYEYFGGFLGAELDMSRATAQVRNLQTIYKIEERYPVLLQVETTFGWAEEHHETEDVPIFERFYLGGARTVRGFRYRGLGPHFNRDPIGGTIEHWGSFEVSMPIYQHLLRGVGFFDTGNLASDVNSFSAYDYRFVVGGGFLVTVPLLGQYVPIRLYWGNALHAEDEDREQVFLFDIGFGL